LRSRRLELLLLREEIDPDHPDARDDEQRHQRALDVEIPHRRRFPLRQIHAARVSRMTAREPRNGSAASTQCAMTANTFASVFRAARMEAAARAERRQHWRHQQLVETNDREQKPLHDAHRLKACLNSRTRPSKSRSTAERFATRTISFPPGKSDLLRR